MDQKKHNRVYISEIINAVIQAGCAIAETTRVKHLQHKATLINNVAAFPQGTIQDENSIEIPTEDINLSISHFLPLLPHFPSLCFLQVSTGRVWGIQPPQWICPTCRRRGKDSDETRTVRQSTPSPRCRWDPSQLFGKIAVRLLCSMQATWRKTKSFSWFLRKEPEKMSEKSISLWGKSLLTVAFELVSVETQTNTHIHRQSYAFGSSLEIDVTLQKPPALLLAAVWPLWFIHTLGNSVHLGHIHNLLLKGTSLIELRKLN